MKTHQDYYTENEKYSLGLEKQKSVVFRKYCNKVQLFLKKNDMFLDVGCGTGLAVQRMKKINAYGVDISSTSIQKCLEKDLHCSLYDGRKIPHRNQSFDGVGCFDVLEHVDSPQEFLSDMLRLVKPGGYLFIVCPNFLSVTNSYHYRTKGMLRKLRNLLLICKKFFSTTYQFDKMATITRENFQPDDDACNVTNPIDINRWGTANNLKQIYWSGRSVDTTDTKLDKLIDRPPFKVFLGSSFIIFQKP